MLLSSIYCYVEESSYTLLPEIYIYIYIFFFFSSSPLEASRIFLYPQCTEISRGCAGASGPGCGDKEATVLNAVLCTHPLKSLHFVDRSFWGIY